MRRGIIGIAVLFSIVLAISNYSFGASDYPNRDITFIVPFGSGGSTDPIARQFVAQLEKILNVNINVENKPGGAATIGSGIVVRAKPDGYTIGLGSNSSLTYQPLVNKSLPYSSPDDYQPIVHLGELPAVLAVRTDAPWKTFDEFMDNARKNPGKVRVSNSGFGTTDDLVIRQLNKAANVKLVPVSFTGGGGEAMVALLGGRLEASSRRAITTTPFTKSGKVRVLGSFTKGKYYMYPEVTAIGDIYNATLPAMYCVFAPKGMPKEVYDKLVSASLQAVKAPEYVAFAKANGYIGDVKGPDETKAELINYTALFIELLKDMEKK